jgi:RNA polymerase sigma factor (sigma-70 family)
MNLHECLPIDFKELTVSLYPYAYGLVRNSEDAKDLIQDMFLKILNNKSFEYNNKDKARGYMMIALRHLNMDRSRHESMARSKQSDYYRDTKNSIHPDILSRLEFSDARTVINGLPDRYKTFIALYLEGYSYKDICKICKVKMGTLCPAIKTIKRRIKQSCI